LKFFTLVILPPGTVTTSRELVVSAARALMEPHGEQATSPDDNNYKWDGYTETPRDMLEHYGYDVSGLAGEDDLLLAALDDLTQGDFQEGGRLGMPAILTPSGDWLASPVSGKVDDEAAWLETALQTAKRYPNHHGVVLFCRK
jgi:hypothetical protein